MYKTNFMLETFHLAKEDPADISEAMLVFVSVIFCLEALSMFTMRRMVDNALYQADYTCTFQLDSACRTQPQARFSMPMRAFDCMHGVTAAIASFAFSAASAADRAAVLVSSEAV